jgi:hypothetical protein
MLCVLEESLKAAAHPHQTAPFRLRPAEQGGTNTVTSDPLIVSASDETRRALGIPYSELDRSCSWD